MYKKTYNNDLPAASLLAADCAGVRLGVLVVLGEGCARRHGAVHSGPFVRCEQNKTPNKTKQLYVDSQADINLFCH